MSRNTEKVCLQSFWRTWTSTLVRLFIKTHQEGSFYRKSNHFVSFFLLIVTEKCPLCFGLLPHFALPTTSDELMGIIGKSGYQIEDYALRLRLPTAMMLRHWRAWSLLQQSFPYAFQRDKDAIFHWNLTFNTVLLVFRASKLFARSPISDSVVEVKEAIRWVFSQATFRKLRIEHKHRVWTSGKSKNFSLKIFPSFFSLFHSFRLVSRFLWILHTRRQNKSTRRFGLK